MRSSSVEADERRFQRRRQRQVVVGQERRAARRDEVEHGDVLADVEAVGAGDRHARLLEGADHRLEGRPALAHEDRGCRRRARPCPSRRPRASRRARRGRCGRATTTGGEVGSACVDRQGPGVGLVVRFGPLDVGHSSTSPGACGRALSCTVPITASSNDRPRKWRSTEKVASTADEHRLGRAERQGQAHVLEARARPPPTLSRH